MSRVCRGRAAGTYLRTLVAALLLAGLLPPVPALGAAAGPSRHRAVDLDVLYVGAHPDDEAFALSTFGQWDEYHGVRTGVVTITRGEGGGNAVGPEEGPALGLIREAEERRAVARAGIRNIYNFDQVDFYYTTSSPLTEQVWGRQDTLDRLVRVIRTTRPELLLTMDPAPSPGNHGHHQYAARLAVEAFTAAADPRVFPAQITREGLRPWQASTLAYRGAEGEGPSGPQCVAGFTPTEPTDTVYGVWDGRFSRRHGARWSTVEREAQREYASQGWAVFPDAPTDPADIGCDYFTLVDSRVPLGATADPLGLLRGSVLRPAGGLPRGTQLYLTSDRFDTVAGQPVEVTAHVRVPAGAQGRATLSLRVPRDWTGGGTRDLGVAPGRQVRARFTVTPPDGAPAGRVRLRALLRVGEAVGRTWEVVRVAPAVEGTVVPLPQVTQFRRWTDEVGAPQLDNLIVTRLALAFGDDRRVRVHLHNRSDSTQTGTVELHVPAGFTVTPARWTYFLGSDSTVAVRFRIRNTDADLPTGNYDGDQGDYPFTVVTTSQDGRAVEEAALNLVPRTTVPQAPDAPRVDGVESPGEYVGPALDLSRLWEGEPPASPADASGTAKVTWHERGLSFIVHVTDDVLGAVVEPDDAKRHWRTDSVEITLDPEGDSENTSTTFKVGIFPTTTGGAPAASRDADNHQGPIAVTAPGMTLASRVSQPYTGYTVETMIPFEVLPSAIDQRMGMNLFIYDSDTQDKTGQTRLGWSTWGGVQGDPYRWGRATLPGYTPAPGLPDEPKEPIIPTAVARSVRSPQSILQSARDGVALAGGPHAPAGDTVRLAASPRLRGRTVVARLAASGPGMLKGHIQHPVQPIFNTPVLPHRVAESHPIGGQ